MEVTHMKTTLNRWNWKILAFAAAVVISIEPYVAAADVTFEVNSTVDAADANPGDGVCASAAGACTLRAAIEETNNLRGADSVVVPAGDYLLERMLETRDDLTITGAGRDVVSLDGQNSAQILRVDRAYELLVCDAARDSIESFDIFGDHNGRLVDSGVGGLDNPVAITSRGFDGHLFVVSGFSGIQEFEEDGTHVGVFLDPNNFNALFTDIDYNFNFVSRRLFATSSFPVNAVFGFRSDRSDLVSLVHPGSGGLQSPSSTVVRDDNLYVADLGGDQILRYDAENGAFIDVFARSGLAQPADLVFHNDSLYVANRATNSILRFDGQTGGFIETFVAAGAGGLTEPTALAFGPDGMLYVISNGDVLRFDGTTGAFIDEFISGGTTTLQRASCLL